MIMDRFGSAKKKNRERGAKRSAADVRKARSDLRTREKTSLNGSEEINTIQILC